MRILVVEDDRLLNNTLCYNLYTAGYVVDSVLTKSAASNFLTKQDYDLIVLDVNLPDGNGFDFCREAKERRSDTAIIFLTANDMESDMLRGYELGADDYVTKPFNPVELQARVKSQIRRYMLLGSGQKVRTKLSAGGIELDDKLKEVTLDGEPVSLTRTEYDILKLLMEHPGEVYSPKQIYEAVWKGSPCGVENTVAVHIRHLREKLEYNPAEPRYLKVVWGRGYKMEDVENE